MFRDDSFLSSIPPVVKNIIIINLLFFFASLVLPNALFDFSIDKYLGLHALGSEAFTPFQLISYMFLHGGFSHIFFNMFALFMFGRILESHWGSKRFFIYYMVTGVGAGLVQLATQYYQLAEMSEAITQYLNNANPTTFHSFIENKFVASSHEVVNHFNGFRDTYNELIRTDPPRAVGLSKEWISQYQIDYYNSFVTIGASGAVFGILLAFGMTFPNVELMLLFPPIPIKAKYFVIMYGAIEIFMGVGNFQYDNVAHWAHLGGMLFGFILLYAWRKNGRF